MLSIITIGYNVIEGVVSLYFGIEGEALSIIGFGIDSLVEVVSGLGILHMVLRLKKLGSEAEKRMDEVEIRALQITGFSFYLLAGGLLAGTIFQVLSNERPDATLAGLIIAILSILTMYFLMQAKLSVGKALDSQAIISDSNCTKTCFYLSFILLISSGMYHFFGIWWVESLGSVGIAYFAYKEGKEAFGKAKNKSISCACEDGCHD